MRGTSEPPSYVAMIANARFLRFKWSLAHLTIHRIFKPKFLVRCKLNHRCVFGEYCIHAMRERVEFIDEPRDTILTAMKFVDGRSLIVCATQIISDAERSVILIGVTPPRRIVRLLQLLQDAFQIRVHHEGQSFLPVVVVEGQPPLVVPRENDGALVRPRALDAVSGQFVSRGKVMKTSARERSCIRRRRRFATVARTYRSHMCFACMFLLI